MKTLDRILPSIIIWTSTNPTTIAQNTSTAKPTGNATGSGGMSLESVERAQ